MSDPIYALIDSTGSIVNRVVGGVAPPDGLTAVLETDTPLAIGGTIVSGVYTPPAVLILPRPPVAQVTPRQARLALLAAGLLDQVQAAVDAAGGATKITWDHASTFDRNDPLIASIGSALNLTPAQIDALFAQAATL